jgi:hypothetical protein
MPTDCNSSLLRAASALGFLLVLAGCTPGGQFDPTEMFNSDVFNTKTKLKGDRVPLFPDGVPGTTTGVPADLVKGYQPPPDQTDADANSNAGAVAPPPKAEPPKPKPKVASIPKPKPKIAAAPAQTQTQTQTQNKDAIWNQTPAGSAPTRITVGPTSNPAAVQQQQPASQSVWPAPPSTAPAQSSQSIWPNPPATGTSSQ